MLHSIFGFEPAQAPGEIWSIFYDDASGGFVVQDQIGNGLEGGLDEPHNDTATYEVAGKFFIRIAAFPYAEELMQDYPEDGVFIRTECLNFNLTEVVSDGQGGERWGQVVEYNSAACNYVPPCDLMPLPPLVSGYNVQLSASTSYPPVQYSINGAAFSAQNSYDNLPSGVYQVSYIDANGCTAGNFFTIAPTVDNVYYSQNPIWYTVFAPAGSVVEAELMVETQHYLGDYRSVISMSKTAGADGKCHFRLDSILSKLLQAELPSQIIICKRNILNYFVSYKVGSVQSESGFNTVLMGGTPLEVQQHDLFGEYSPFGRFLTNQPKVKKIDPYQPEYLYWLHDGSSEQVRIRYAHYHEGIDTPAYSFLDEALKKHELLRLQLSMAGARKVEVCVVDQAGNQVSELRTYVADMQAKAQDKIFLFANSLGGFDTLRCTGEREELSDVKEEIGQRELQPGADMHYGQRFIFNQTTERKFRQSTGQNSDMQQAYLKEFVFSPARFEYVNLAQPLLLPVILLKKVLTNSTLQERKGYTFEYEYAFDQVGYAKY